jgi:hypothetical protein
MKTKQERNLSTGLAVRTTLKAGTCVSYKCEGLNNMRINDGMPVSDSLVEYNRCLKSACPPV